LLLETATSRDDRALFAELLSLPNDGRYPQLVFDAQQKRQRTLMPSKRALDRSESTSQY